jgi:hypothetical protein
MFLEQVRSYRLGPRGGPSLACDEDGVALGSVTLVSVTLDAGGNRRCDVRRPDQITRLLNLAYGPHPEAVAERLQRGLRRVATALEEGDLAGAGIEAVMLRLPDVDAEGLSKLAAFADLEKGGTSWQDEPRVPAGQPEGGQWTAGGEAAGSPSGRRPSRAGSSGGAGRGTTPPPSPSQAEAGAGETIAVSPVRESRKQNANGFYANSAGGGVFYIPSVSAGHPVKPTEIHALDANAFQVGWDPNGEIRLKDVNRYVYAVAANQPAIEHFNTTTGRSLGVSIYAFPAEALHPDVEPTFVDFTNSAAGTLVDAANWLQQPATHVPVLPEIAAGEPSFPMGAAWEETTDPGAFQAWRPVSHLEAATDALSVVGAVAPGIRAAAGANAAVRIAVGGDAAIEITAETTGDSGRIVPSQLGDVGEAASAELTGLPKNTLRIPSASGARDYRIPDHLDPLDQRYIAETKNVKYQSLTLQLRDDAAHVLRGGYPGRVDVIIDDRTVISSSLLREHLNPGSPIKIVTTDLNPK